jgi:hypothetical protein
MLQILAQTNKGETNWSAQHGQAYMSQREHGAQPRIGLSTGKGPGEISAAPGVRLSEACVIILRRGVASSGIDRLTR